MMRWTAAGTALSVVCIAAALAGCGKLGELQRPGPLSAKTEPSRTVDTVDPRDRVTDLALPDTNSSPR